MSPRRRLAIALLGSLAFVFAAWRGGVWGGPGIWSYPVLWIAELLIGMVLVAAVALHVSRWRPDRADAPDPA